MLHQNSNNIQWLEFELLQDYPKIIHGSFLRHGGVSTGDFTSLNIGYGVGDDTAAAINRKKIHKILGGETIILHDAIQVHEATVVEVTKDSPDTIPSCDGLITNTPGHALMIKHGDCQPAIFYDPIHNAIGAVHSGWKGSIKNIYAATIAAMGKHYDSSPKDLLVGIGPCLGPQASEFINYKKEFPESIWKYRSDNDYFDFWKISTDQLIEAGILSTNIEIARICTYSNPDDYFSYRRKKISGRHATVVAIQQNDHS